MNQDQYTVGNLFERTPCLTQAVLMKYAAGKLSGLELRKVEMHLIDCGFCDAAVDGYKDVGAQQFETMLHNLDTRITAHEEQTTEEEEEEEEKDNVIEFKPQVVQPAASVSPRRFLPIFGIAASIILLAVFGIMFMGGGRSASDIATDHFSASLTTDARGLSDAQLVRYEEAELLHKEGKYEAAVSIYDSIDSLGATFHAGECYLQLGKYDLAAKRFQSVIDAQQDWVEDAQFDLSLTYLYQNRIPDATALLETIAGDAGHSYQKQAKETLAEVKDL